MATINDWFNENEFSAPYDLTEYKDSYNDPAQFTGWTYGGNYTRIYVNYTGGHEFTWDCENETWIGDAPR